jgi:hypothetical protein
MVTTYQEVQPGAWTELLGRLRETVRGASALEHAAQAVACELVREFRDTTALARVYALVPNQALPDDVRRFVDDLADDHGVALAPATPVLCLLGTHGEDPAWCDRRTSERHRGIPLVSRDFVAKIPMIARLLKELGIDLEWLDEAPEFVTRRLLGGFNGVFFVRDAASAKDALGRQIIPAQDFVEEHGVKTVFGMGGFYPNGTMIVCIVFTRETLERSQVERFQSLISMLKGETFGLARSGRYFESESAASAQGPRR